MSDELSELEKSILKEMKTKKITEAEAKAMLKQLKTPPPRIGNTVDRHYGGKKFKIGIVSDIHFGHHNFREDVFNDSVKTFNKEKVDEIYIPGDIIEGMSGRDGHIYELNIPGVSQQLKYAVDHLNQYRQPITAILGNHDLWAMKKGNQGVHVGSTLESQVKDFKLVGDMIGDVKIGDITVRMSHEGATSYALSYSMQKRINAISGGNKPNIILNGHLHKQLYMFYRNIHAMECGTLEDQTEFMAMKGSPAHVGYSIIDVEHNKNGVTKFTPTFYSYYD